MLKLGNVGDSDPADRGGFGRRHFHDSDPTIHTRTTVSAVAKLRKPNEEIMALPEKIMIDRDGDARVRDYAKRTIVHFEKVD